MLEFGLAPHRDDSRPVYRQLADGIKALIVGGKLSPGVKLPASRELAVTAGVHRNTATRAYRELASQGYVTAHVGQGTFVALDAVRPSSSVVRAPSEAGGVVWSSLLARGVRDLPASAGFRPPSSPPRSSVRYSFQGGLGANDLLPAGELRRAFSEAVTTRLPEVAGTLEPRGYLPLRQALARYLVGRGVVCDAGDVLVVNGSQQALDLMARLLVDEGDTVAIEDPGYFGARIAFAGRGASLVGIAVDGEGLRTGDLARVLRRRRLKLIHVTPASQCPTGGAMSPARREELLTLAAEYDTPVLEDDYGAELRFEGPVVVPLKALDPTGLVVYVGTFSKVLFPGLRLGFLVAPQPLMDKLVLSKWVADFQTNVVAQAAMAELLGSGSLERHLRRVREACGRRLRAMLTALEDGMPEGVSWTRPKQGQAVWLRLPEGVDAAALREDAARAGVVYSPGEAFYLDGAHHSGLALSFASLDERAIHQGISLLGRLVGRQVARGSRAANRTLPREERRT